jgi:hypothetical protein
VPYASLEHVIEENKDLYYKALRRTQLTLKSTQADWEPWLGFFLRCLKNKKIGFNKGWIRNTKLLLLTKTLSR